jgi:hypothetical protein
VARWCDSVPQPALLSNIYPEAKSVGHWLRYGWTVPIAYVVGFFVLLLMIGWHPDAAPGQSSP